MKIRLREHNVPGGEGTNGIDEAPIFDLKGAADFAVAVKRMCAGVAWDGDIVRMAR